MTPLEQNELLCEITVVLVSDLPTGWRRLVLDYAALGRKVSVGAGVRMTDGTTVQVPVDKTLAPSFARLRRGMYIEGLGTWHSLSLVIDPPNTYHASYDRDGVPRLDLAHVPAEQEKFPRAPEHQPDWYVTASR